MSCNHAYCVGMFLGNEQTIENLATRICKKTYVRSGNTNMMRVYFAFRKSTQLMQPSVASISTQNGWSIVDFRNWKHYSLSEIVLSLYNQSLFQYKKIHVCNQIILDIWYLAISITVVTYAIVKREQYYKFQR